MSLTFQNLLFIYQYIHINVASPSVLHNDTHTYRLRPSLISQLDVCTQPQLQQSYKKRSRHDTLMIAIMKHCSHERFTSSEMVSIMVVNSSWFPKHILSFSPIKCAHSFCPDDRITERFNRNTTASSHLLPASRWKCFPKLRRGAIFK